jgi:SAM-dependent methyltransferase
MERAAVSGWRTDGTDREREPLAEEADYRPFPDVRRRNAWQKLIEVPTMARALSLPRGKRVLEVGCGRGVALPPLARLLRPTRLVGLDIDGALLEEAAARLRGRTARAELVEGDVREMPFPDSSFDVVVDFGTCYHIARSGQALGEIARVLAEGGVFVYETRASQVLSHPVRAWGRRLPWHLVPSLVPQRHALLWAARSKPGCPEGRPTFAPRDPARRAG